MGMRARVDYGGGVEESGWAEAEAEAEACF